MIACHVEPSCAGSGGSRASSPAAGAGVVLRPPKAAGHGSSSNSNNTSCTSDGGGQSGDDLYPKHCPIAQHYHARRSRTRRDREASPIRHLKTLHSWIKGLLIQLYAPRGGAAALDLACGKGADLATWLLVGARLYVGVDVVESSLQEARRRHQELMRQLGQAAATSAPEVRFLCADGFAPGLPAWILATSDIGQRHTAAAGGRTPTPLHVELNFDVCSCMFALHYSWSSEARARAALASVASLLRPGGFFVGTIIDADVVLARLRRAPGTLTFGNSIYRVTFDKADYAKTFRCVKEPFGIQYEFHLTDAVDHCPEWLVPFDALRNLANNYGLELVFKKNFQDFVNQYSKKDKDMTKLMQMLGAQGAMSAEEWECVSLYLAFAFQKKIMV